jgi:hypothetical protein
MTLLPQPTIDVYIEKLLSEKHPGEVDPILRNKFKAELVERLDNFLKTKLLTSLEPPDLKAFAELLDKKSNQTEIQQFVSKKIPDQPSFIADALLEFRQLYLELA